MKNCFVLITSVLRTIARLTRVQRPAGESTHCARAKFVPRRRIIWSVAGALALQLAGSAYAQTHSADTDHSWSISLVELTRVIELFNTRNGTTRTGAYKVQAGTEDGFAPDPTRAPNTAATLTQYHSTDENHDGAISLIELTRAIELYNYRRGTRRTGEYHVQAGTEDGFAPGPAAPVVTSASVSGAIGSVFSYQIVGSFAPASYGASGLPNGIWVNTSTGQIYGLPTQSGTFSVSLSATNPGGTGSGTLTLTVNPPPAGAPAISSASTALGAAGNSFSYQITAANSPTSFSANGLPAGLTINASTGQISGTPSVAGAYWVIITATNNVSSYSAALTINVGGATAVSLPLNLNVHRPAK